jgi:hypothetical protein
VNLETHRKASNTAIESLNIDGMIINNQQLTSDTVSNCCLSTADNINNNNNNDVHKQNKYNHKKNYNNSFLQSMSQTYKFTYSE